MSFTYSIRLTALLGVYALALLVSTSHAEPVNTDIRLKAGFCINCHNANDTTSAIPNLLGRPKSELHDQLMAFKTESAPTNTIMTRLISGFTNEDISALAQYFSQQTPPSSGITNNRK